MDVYQLQLFVAVVNTQSMSKAAQQMHITQSAVSQSIARLEKEVGAELFIRENRSVRLIETGRIFYNHAIRILDELDAARVEVKEADNAVLGLLRLKVLAASAMMPDLLAQFSQLYPDVRYQMIQQNLQDNFDLCITYASDEFIPEGADLLLDEEVMLAVPTFHRLAAYSSIPLSEAKEEGFILMREGSVLRTWANHICRMAKFEPRIVFEGDSPATVRQMIIRGLGIAFVPKVSWHAVVDERIRLLRIESPVCRRRLYIFAPKERKNSTVTSTFREYAISYFNQYNSQICGEANASENNEGGKPAADSLREL